MEDRASSPITVQNLAVGKTLIGKSSQKKPTPEKDLTKKNKKKTKPEQKKNQHQKKKCFQGRIIEG